MKRMKHNKKALILRVVCILLVSFALLPRQVASDDRATQIKEIATLKGHKDWVSAVAFSPDSRLLASCGFDKKIKLWDVAQRREIATLSGHGGNVLSVAFSPDGRMLASASLDRTVKLWDVEQYKNIGTLEGHTSEVLTVAFSPDGQLLACGGYDERILLWDIKKQKKKGKLKGHKGSVKTVAFSPDGKLLASGGFDNTVILWNVKRKKIIARLEGHKKGILSVAFSPDGKILVSSSYDRTVKLWDVASQQNIATLKGHEKRVNSIAFSPDGRTLASASDDLTVKLWDIASLRSIAVLRGHENRIRGISLSSDGQLLASASWDNTVKLWNVGSYFGPPRPKYNPNIKITAGFAESSGNNILEEGETASINFVIYNRGRGQAYNLQPVLTLPTSHPNVGIALSEPDPLAILNPGDSSELVATIVANDQVTDETVELRLQVMEANGFDSDPVVLRFQTRATRPPKLEVSEWAIDDDSEGESQGNSNLQFELGEIAEVTLRITNSGEGTTHDAKLLLSLPRAPNVFYQSASSEFELGNIPPGGSKDITFAISTNKRFTADFIELSAQFIDAYARFNSESIFKLPLQQLSSPLPPIDIVPIVEQNGVVDILPSLTSLVDTDIPTTGMSNPDAVAVIIGNTRYTDRDIPPVDFASRDAAIMKEYLVKMLGYEERNILYYIDADLRDFNTLFGREGRYKGRLYDYVKPDRSDVFVYYSGHGAPDPETKRAFLLPSDSDRNAISMTGFNRNTLFENLAKLKTRSITVVLDACFSGMSDAGSLMGDVSPVAIEVEPSARLNNGTVFSSSEADQVSTWYREQKHGLFTYFFLKGIRGSADYDGDSRITIEELETYLTDPADGVPYWARRLKSREQTPVVIAEDKSKVIVELKK